MSDLNPHGVPRITLIQNLILVPLTEIAVRLIGWKRSWRILSHLGPKIKTDRSPQVEVNISLKALKRGKMISPIYGKCLARSMVLWWQLHRRDVPVSLSIGVRKKINFRAHAWVEFEQKPLNAGKQVHARYNEIAKFNHPDNLK